MQQPAAVTQRYPGSGFLDFLVRIIGWRATLLGDPATTDRWRFLQSHLRPGDLRTLDAGCGSGAFTMYAAHIGNRALGLSFDDGQLQKANRRAKILGLRNVQFQQVDLRELDHFAEHLGRFEQIMCLECIEHISHDRKLITDLAALVEPSGILILTTPYKHHIPNYSETISSTENGGQVRWGYTHEELRKMLVSAAMTVVAVGSFHGWLAQKIISLRLHLLAYLPSVLALAFNVVLIPLHLLDRPVSALVRYPPLTNGVVAMKPPG